MIKKLKEIFFKNDEDGEIFLPENERIKFTVEVDDFTIGTLESKNGKWHFSYSDDFKLKSEQKKYRKVVGFPDLTKEYVSEKLWPFFKIRIPGLKQPSIKKILKEEEIDKTNEAELLKRFGKNTVSNPYILEIH